MGDYLIIPETTIKVQVVCPICKTQNVIGIPQSTINSASQLTTVSVHKGLICPHHFQIFIDKNFKIRGYQKVDLELEEETTKDLRNGVIVPNNDKNQENLFFEKLILKENIVKYNPPNRKNDKQINEKIKKNKNSEKEMTLEEIYKEFWEFIDENNEQFQEFILKDKRRKRSPLKFNSNNLINQLELDHSNLIKNS